MADLLVSYLNKTKNYNTQAAAPLDISTKDRIKPFEDKGTLLPSRIFGSPIQYAKDLGKDVVNIGKGVRGKSNDHNLGRMNDIGMKVGSLAIATYLFMKNPLKLSKTMEFVGFGSFFASMALWPKLFIQLPLKLKTGVDIHRKYVDSENRKKLFFQDPKYVPWSLVSQEELNKIGKKNNIREDLPNRNDAIKATAQKVAVQGNTLWMMTAGFATPLMSSLICRTVEEPIAKAQMKKRLSESSEKISQLMNPIKKAALQAGEYKITAKTAEETLEQILEKYGEKEMTPEIIDNITKELVGDLPASQAGIAKQLKAIAKATPTIEINEKAIIGLMEDNDELLSLTGLDADKFKEIIKSHFSSGKTYEQATRSLISDIIGRCGEDVSILDRETFKEGLSNSLSLQKPVSQVAKVSAYKQQLKQISDLFASFNADRNVVQQYVNARVAQTSDSFIAHQWKKVNDKFFKVLGITHKDLVQAKAGGMDTETLLVRKLEELAKKDTGSYKTAMAEMAAVIEEYDKTLSTQLMDSVSGRSFEETAKSALDSITNDAAARFKNAGFEDIAKTFVGEDIEQGLTSTSIGSLKNTLKQMVDYEMLGARACFYRMFESMDLYKRLNSGAIERQLRALGGHIDGLNASPGNIQEFLWKEIVDTLPSNDQKNEIKGSDIKEAIAKKAANEHKLVQRLVLMSDNNKGEASDIMQKMDEYMQIQDPTQREDAIRSFFEQKYPSAHDQKYLEKMDSLVREHIQKNLPTDALYNNINRLKKEHDLVRKLYVLLIDDKGKAEWLIKQIDDMAKIADVDQREQMVKSLIQQQFPDAQSANYARELTNNAVHYVRNVLNEKSISQTLDKHISLQGLGHELFALSSKNKDLAEKAEKLIDEIDTIMTYANAEARTKAIKDLFAEQLGTKQHNEFLQGIIDDAIDYSRRGFASGSIEQKIKALSGDVTEIRTALENVFGRKLKTAQDYHGALQKLSNLQGNNKGQAEYIVKQVNNFLASKDITQVEGDITELIEKEFSGWEDKTFPNSLKDDLINFARNNHRRGALDEAFNDFQGNRFFWANIANAMSDYDEGRITEIVSKIKNTLIKGKITDQTEKLFTSSDEYKAIMHILYQQDFDGATQQALKTDGKSLFSNFEIGIKKVREDIIDFIGVAKSWRYPGRDMIGFEGVAKPDFKHRLIAKSLVDTIKEHADTTFNSTKWLKMFGGGFAALVGVTLAAELLFGKKDSSLKGGNK